MGAVIWQAELGRTLTAELGHIRLTVQSLQGSSGEARYIVTGHKQRDKAGSLICSGVVDNVRDAMQEAERVAARLHEPVHGSEVHALRGRLEKGSSGRLSVIQAWNVD